MMVCMWMGFCGRRKTEGLSGFWRGQGRSLCGKRSSWGHWAGERPAKSPSLGCIPQVVCYVTVVALCHPAVSLKLPGDRIRVSGTVWPGGKEVCRYCFPWWGSWGCPRSARCPRICCPGARHMEAFGIWSMLPAKLLLQSDQSLWLHLAHLCLVSSTADSTKESWYIIWY